MIAAPRVSVIMPCHNYGQFVEEAIRSAQEQSCPPQEIVVCDDGSSDHSWDVLQRVASVDHRVRLLRHHEPLGLISTFNELVIASTGEVIIPLSSDDMLNSIFIEMSLRELDRTGADFAYPTVRAFGAESWVRKPLAMDADRLARWNFICATAAIRRGVFEAVPGYRAAFESVGFEDYDFWISVVEAGFVGVPAPEAELLWRRHSCGSRNTADAVGRLRLRWALLWHHPRYFVHPRSLKAVLGRFAAGDPDSLG